MAVKSFRTRSLARVEEAPRSEYYLQLMVGDIELLPIFLNLNMDGTVKSARGGGMSAERAEALLDLAESGQRIPVGVKLVKPEEKPRERIQFQTLD